MLITIFNLLLIEEIAGLVVELPFNALDVRTGETLKLECFITDVPKNTTFYWSFKGMTVDEHSRNDESLGSFNFKSTLTLTNITRQNAGSYFCIAYNKQEGSHASDVTTVYVMYAPVNNYKKQQVVRVLENFPTPVTYNAPGYPEPVIEIYRNQNELLNVYNKNNNTLTLPSLVADTVKTYAVNSMGKTELPFKYIVVELIESPDFLIQSETDHFKLKLSTNGISDNMLYLILVEKFGSQRYSQSPIDVDLTFLTSCSVKGTEIVRNIVEDFSSTVFTNEPQKISKSFLSQLNHEELEPETEYLIWVLKSKTFICPDGENWAIQQPIAASDYQIMKTLPMQSSLQVVEKKTNEILIAIIIAGAAIVVIMIFSTIILSTTKLCEVKENDPRTSRMQQYVSSSSTHHKKNQELFGGEGLDHSDQLELRVAAYREGASQRFQNIEILNARNTSAQENLYSMPDEYHSREAMLGNVSNRSDTGSYTAQIAHPVYVDNASSFYTPPVDRSHVSARLSRMSEHPAILLDNSGLKNPAFHWSRDQLLTNNPPFLASMSEEQGHLNDSITETIAYEMHSFNHSGEIERFRNILQRSSDSSTLTEHTRSGETYYNTPVIAQKPFKKGANSKKSTLERCPEWIRRDRTRKASTPTRFKALPENVHYLNFRTNSLPELLWRESASGPFSDLQSISGSSTGLVAPRNMKSRDRNQDKSLSTNDLTYDPSLKSLNTEVLYLQIWEHI